MRRLFVTGTDTNVGKTYVAAMVVRALRRQAEVWAYTSRGQRLPPRGDRLISDNALTLCDRAGEPGELDRVCPQCFAAPVAPHLAAQMEGKQIDAALLRSGIEYWKERSEIVVVEEPAG